MNKTTQQESRDLPELGVLEWVCHLEDKDGNVQCVSEVNPPEGVAIYQQERKFNLTYLLLLSRIDNKTDSLDLSQLH